MTNKRLEERIQYLRQYPWSSYLSYIGKHKALDYVDYGPILEEMSGQRKERPKRYRQFVESGLAKSDADFKAALGESPRSIGSNTFRAWVDNLYQKLVETHKHPEDVSFRHMTEPLATNTVLKILSDVFEVPLDEFRQRRRNSSLRGVAGRFLCRYTGLTQRDVAVTLQAGSGAAISQQMKKVAGQLLNDQRLRRLVEEAEERLRHTLDGL